MPDKSLQLIAAVELQAADTTAQPGKVSMLAYSGGFMNVPGWGNVVVDLAGLAIAAQTPLLADHENKIGSVAGHGIARVVSGQLIVEGALSDATEAGKQIRALAREGLQLQASVGVEPLETRRLRAGEKITVNGKSHTTPKDGATLVVRGRLREVTICALGCDSQTAVRVAAKHQGNNTMPESATTIDTPDPVTVERDRIKRIEAATRGDWGAQAQRVATLKAQAIDNEITTEALNAELVGILRASRPTAPNINTGAAGPDAADVLEASLAMSCGVSPKFLEAEGMSKDVLHEAVSARHRGASLHTVIRAANRVAGNSIDNVNDTAIRAAYSQGIHAAGGFSTLSVTDILSNTANKVLLSSYNAVAATWRKFCAPGSNKDFKQATQYRLISDGTFAEVGPGGEIKHGSLSDQSFTTQLQTRGKILAITRTDMINDDLGAFSAGPRLLGRDAAVALEERVYTIFLDNASFFAGGNSNLATSNPFGIDGLTAAELLFKNQTDPAGRPTMIDPKTLLVPNALAVAANQVTRSVTVNELSTDAAAASVPGDRVMVGNSNPHAGRFEVVVSPWLSNATLGGAYSTSTWYLLADPVGGVAVATVSFLNGQQSPTIETADADFSTLGIQMRCFFDYGVDLADPRAGVKSTA